MTTVEVERLTRAAGVRWVAFDAFRGLAVLAMLADHLTLVLGGPDLIRLTVGRLAVPMFFLLAGYLVTRPRWRHLGIGLVGLLLPVAVPWIDSPNVLATWALGVVVIWLWRLGGLPVWGLAALGLVLFANDWGQVPGSYPPAALIGLMALGTMVPRSAFEWARHAPGWVAAIGRHPVGWYVGHLLVLQVMIVLAGSTLADVSFWSESLTWWLR